MTKSAKITLIKLLIVLLLSGSMLMLPFEEWGVPINTVQSRVIALFVFAALMWILEVIPIWTTSVLVITLTLLCMSNQSLNFMQVERFDSNAVKAIIADAYGPEADAATVAATQATVIAELKKQTSLSPAVVRTSINNAILAPVVNGEVEKAAQAENEAAAAAAATAATAVALAEERTLAAGLAVEAVSAVENAAAEQAAAAAAAEAAQATATEAAAATAVATAQKDAAAEQYALAAAAAGRAVAIAEGAAAQAEVARAAAASATATANAAASNAQAAAHAATIADNTAQEKAAAAAALAAEAELALKAAEAKRAAVAEDGSNVELAAAATNLSDAAAAKAAEAAAAEQQAVVAREAAARAAAARDAALTAAEDARKAAEQAAATAEAFANSAVNAANIATEKKAAADTAAAAAEAAANAASAAVAKENSATAAAAEAVAKADAAAAAAALAVTAAQSNETKDALAAVEQANNAATEAKMAADAAAAKAAAAANAKPALLAAAGRLYSGPVSEQIDNLKLVSVAKQKSIFGTFADPIIILFLGGFFLADAATKFRRAINLARVLLKPFGTNPKFVLLGLMSVTAIFSMFMSNTATAAMMLALLTPVLALFKPEDRGRAAFALCIPIGANVGGIGTPIGTPPNAIALKYMQDLGLDVTFGKWMMFGIPFVLIMLLVGWLVLLKMFPISQKSLDLSKELKGKFLTTPKAIVVYATFIITIPLWVIPKDYHGLDANSVAIIPIVVFSVTGVITKKDLRGMAWDVLWLVAGGFALGVALSETNLAKDMINAIPFGEWNSTVLLIGASCICLFMATFMSHTATAALLVPILGGVAGAMMKASSMDNAGAVALLVTVAFASSLGMALPISTPPNAMAYATGHIEQKGMAVSGTILCLLGLVITIIMMVGLGAIGFFG